MKDVAREFCEENICLRVYWMEKILQGNLWENFSIEWTINTSGLKSMTFLWNFKSNLKSQTKGLGSNC